MRRGSRPGRRVEPVGRPGGAGGVGGLESRRDGLERRGGTPEGEYSLGDAEDAALGVAPGCAGFLEVGPGRMAGRTALVVQPGIQQRQAPASPAEGEEREEAEEAQGRAAEHGGS